MSPRTIFLIDGLGALVSAAMLGLVLPRLGGIFGMPLRMLNVLAVIPIIFAAYSLLCFAIKPLKWSFYLTIIAIANLLYCCLTVGCLIWFQHQLTVWDYLYFVGEIVVVVVLAVYELYLAKPL